MIDPKLQSDVVALFPPHPNMPNNYRHQGRRRFRGQRRYYQKIQTRARNFVPELGPEDWYDLWHYHADWPGYGNLGWKHRRAHIAAHCLVFATLIRLLADYAQPYQLWLCFDAEDSSQDGVYFHTPNPNGAHFPASLINVQWGVPPLGKYLSDVLGMPLRAGIGRSPSGNRFYVYSPAHGETLE